MENREKVNFGAPAHDAHKISQLQEIMKNERVELNHLFYGFHSEKFNREHMKNTQLHRPPDANEKISRLIVVVGIHKLTQKGVRK